MDNDLTVSNGQGVKTLSNCKAGSMMWYKVSPLIIRAPSGKASGGSSPDLLTLLGALDVQ